MILLELDPTVVKPGWTPLVITVVLAIVVVLLVLNMRKQLRKIDLPHQGDLDAEEPTPPPAPKEPPAP